MTSKSADITLLDANNLIVAQKKTWSDLFKKTWRLKIFGWNWVFFNQIGISWLLKILSSSPGQRVELFDPVASIPLLSFLFFARATFLSLCMYMCSCVNVFQASDWSIWEMSRNVVCCCAVHLYQFLECWPSLWLNWTYRGPSYWAPSIVYI